MVTPVLPISWEELIDKITILEIQDLKIESITSKKYKEKIDRICSRRKTCKGVSVNGYEFFIS
jgi:hypothetical protein